MTETRQAETWLLGRLLSATTDFLGQKGSSTPRLDAELLLARVLAMSKVQLYVNFEREMSPEELNQYRELVRRRTRHEPVAYILGQKEFYSLPLKTTPAALIPRPETEHLVDAAVRLAKDAWPEEPEIKIADIGCGSGAIGLALARTLPRAKISAVDISPAALALAGENAAALSLTDRVEFLAGDLLAPLAGRVFHLICANLPYIPSAEMAGLMPDVGLHEPSLALDGGRAGLTPIEKLLRHARPHLTGGGRILLEIWPDSLSQLEETAQVLGFTVVEVIRDLAGFQRIVVLS